MTTWLSPFSDLQLILLTASIIFFVSACAIHAFTRPPAGKRTFPSALLFLFLGGLAFYGFAAVLDPFLNPWDERFHALVARNLTEHPFRFTLFDDPVFQTSYDRWDQTVIWLHKPPFFLWLIALSFKLFGFTEFAVRLPSVIMCSLLVPVAWRTGKLLAGPQTGFFAALIAGTSFYLLGLVSGRQPVDHNDVAFLFFVSASLWTWIEHEQSPGKRWIILTGLFAGLAVLCKWLPGLLVFGIWGIYSLATIRRNPGNFRKLIISFLVAMIVILPWQFYIFLKFPVEAVRELNYNAAHFFNVVEGHGGSFWYHFQNTKQLYGPGMEYLIPLGMILLSFRSKDRKLALSVIAGVLCVYLFYSIAQTKMISYPIMAAMLVFIFIGLVPSALHQVLEKYGKSRWIHGFFLILMSAVIIYSNIRPQSIRQVYFSGDGSSWYRKTMSYNKSEFLKMKNEYPGNTVVFNLPGRHYIDCMYYSGFPSYHEIPDSIQMAGLIRDGKTVVIVRDPDRLMPDYLNYGGNNVIIGPTIYKCD